MTNYLEFKPVGTTHVLGPDGPREVPCSKQTLLLNRTVAPREKRLLMRFLQSCVGGAEGAPPPPEGQTFRQHLEAQWGFGDDTRDIILHAIAGVDGDGPAATGVAAVQEYFLAIGKYCPSPFIYPCFGTGEVPQSFCRLCAVYGGVYVLRQRAAAFRVAEGRCVGLVAGGRRIDAPVVVTSEHCVPSACTSAATSAGPPPRVLRACAVVDAAPQWCGDDPVLLGLPPPRHPCLTSRRRTGRGADRAPRGCGQRDGGRGGVPLGRNERVP